MDTLALTVTRTDHNLVVHADPDRPPVGAACRNGDLWQSTWMDGDRCRLWLHGTREQAEAEVLTRLGVA